MSYIGVNPVNNMSRYLEAKPKQSYSQKVLNEIKMISFKTDDSAQPFGSYIYRLQKYPGDIDLVEQFNDCCTEEDVLIKFEIALKRVVNNVTERRTHYFSEVKAGLDIRYNINLGTCMYGTFTPSTYLLEIVTEMYDIGLFSQLEYDIIKKIMKKTVKDGDDYDVINFLVRERRILRWTPKEILNGEKVLPLNKIITLLEALGQETAVKIDVLALVDGKFIEITNYVALGLDKGNGYFSPINIDLRDQHDHATQLPPEVEKLYFSNMYYSPFKMLKRLYSLGRGTKNTDLLLKVIPFVSSNISLLYQMKSEVDTIILIIEKVKSPPKISIFNQLDGMKNRLSTVLELSDDVLEQFYDFIDKANQEDDNDKKKVILSHILKNMKKFINYYTIKYLMTVQLNPPPLSTLPPYPTYQRFIRTPEDDPINPIKKYLR